MVSVTAKFDLNLFPFYRIQGLDRLQLPGLVATTPPKRTARGREADRLLIYLTLSGNTAFSATEYNQITAQMAQRFYQNPGSLTAAMRATVENLNQQLVERNLRTTGKGQYIIGRLILGVLREAQLILAQCGPTHAFHLSGEATRPIHDQQISGRGLGFSQTTPLYFSQAELASGDLLVLSNQLPSTWEAALLTEHGPLVETLRRKLATITTDDLNAVLIQVQPGRGNLNLLPGTLPAVDTAPGREKRPGPEAHPAPSTPTSVPLKPASPPVSQVDSGQPSSRFSRIMAAGQPEVPSGVESPTPADAPQAAQPRAVEADRPDHPTAAAQTTFIKPATAARRLNRTVAPRNSNDLPEISRPGQSGRQKTFRGLAKGLQGVRGFTQKISQGLQTLLSNLLPSARDGQSAVSGASMAFIAVAIPILVVLVASMVYLRYGRVSQFKENYDLAVAAAVGATKQSTPLDIRHGWESAIFYLDKAEAYQVTQESQELRREAQAALDNMDGIVRLDFRPAIIGGLSRTLQVSHMAATDSDLYLLNAARGEVLRAYLTSQGYQMDPTFKCGPGQYGGNSVGTLIDIAALPKVNTRNASVLAMDANGTLLYCAPNADPIAVPLVTPALGWRGIAGFVLDTDGQNLYVLDPLGNAVWVYAGNFGDFPNLPNMFFGEQVPQNMNTAIDLAANGDDLYLLFQDGHVTSCTLSQLDVVPTRCTDPVTFVDNRPGQQSGKTISDAIFTELSFADPPDPSLYFFEPLTQAIYRFSPQPDSLTLQGQFRASEDQRKLMMVASATAMTMSPNRYLFMSVGDQVYFATDVP